MVMGIGMLITTQGLGEYDNIEPSPSSSSTLVVSFKQRFEAEKLFYGSKDIPGVGKVEMSWVSSTTATSAKAGRRDDDDVKMDGASEDGTSGVEKMGAATNGGVGGGGGGKAAEQDFDVAEEDFDVA